MKPLLVSSGEPAGIGPDICLNLASTDLPVVVLGDLTVLKQRAEALNLAIQFIEYQQALPVNREKNTLVVLPLSTAVPVISGQLNVKNSPYVLTMLKLAVEKCLSQEFAGLVTAPVHKGIINEAGIAFSGHTEYLAQHCQSSQVVMMLVSKQMKVALVTTHLPLRAVPDSLTQALIQKVIFQVHQSLQRDFGLSKPRIFVAGLNPHAGEMGYLGREEIDIIMPALEALQKEGVLVKGPFPADTLFTRAFLSEADVFIAMYHDQGLPVLKYAGFGDAVNVSLGLPIIRTSVDHGTALALAGTGQADAGSLLAAVNLALSMCEARQAHANH